MIICVINVFLFLEQIICNINYVENKYILSLKNGELTDLPDTTEFHEKLKSLRQEAEAAYKKEKYEYRPYMNEKLIKSGTIKQKKVVIIQPRIVGKTFWDRSGDIDY